MKEMKLAEVFGVDYEKLGLVNLFGIEKAVIDDSGVFSLVMEVKEEHLNAYGVAHGASLYALCDSAAGAFAAYKNIEGTGADGSIHYYRPAFAGDTLYARVSERKQGKKLMILFIELINSEGKLIADGMFTVMKHTD